jgi:hypothetical protein
VLGWKVRKMDEIKLRKSIHELEKENVLLVEIVKIILAINKFNVTIYFFNLRNFFNEIL